MRPPSAFRVRKGYRYPLDYATLNTQAEVTATRSSKGTVPAPPPTSSAAQPLPPTGQDANKTSTSMPATGDKFSSGLLFSKPRTYNLLSLDGGGVRGLASLYILDGLMKAINQKCPPRPCDVFDMIAGTSTGGLIAIMLGRLKMSVSECIEVYTDISQHVFEPSNFLPFTMGARIQAKFDPVTLEEVIKHIVELKCGNKDTLLYEGQQEKKCKVFVCAVNAANSRIHHFRTYDDPKVDDSEWKNVTIWEACRATSAATSFFPEITINYDHFVDGALGCNNPIKRIHAAAKNLWSSRGQDFDESLQCIVSVGTGVSNHEEIDDSIFGLISSLSRLVTETEKTADDFRDEHMDLVKDGKYFRFNVAAGIGSIGLHEHQKLGEIRNKTRIYINKPEQTKNLMDCAARLNKGSLVVEQAVFDAYLDSLMLETAETPRYTKYKVKTWSLFRWTKRSLFYFSSLIFGWQMIAVIFLTMGFVFVPVREAAIEPPSPKTLINPNAPVFAVVGRTGVGKSTFIDLLGGVQVETGERPVVGDSLKSETADLIWYSAYLDDQQILVIDTPGFDDSEVPDSDILKMIKEGLTDAYQHRDKLIRGIVYMYDISQPRIGGMNRKNLELFQDLVGHAQMQNVAFVTTRWIRRPSPAEAKQELKRESELRNNYLANMIAAGAQLIEHDNTVKSAAFIIRSLLDKPNILLNAQRELLDEMVSKDAEASKSAEITQKRAASRSSPTVGPQSRRKTSSQPSARSSTATGQSRSSGPSQAQTPTASFQDYSLWVYLTVAALVVGVVYGALVSPDALISVVKFVASFIVCGLIFLIIVGLCVGDS